MEAREGFSPNVPQHSQALYVIVEHTMKLYVRTRRRQCHFELFLGFPGAENRPLNTPDTSRRRTGDRHGIIAGRVIQVGRLAGTTRGSQVISGTGKNGPRISARNKCDHR